MLAAVEKEDLDELMKLLKQVIVTAEGFAEGADNVSKVESSRRALQAFHTTAAMLGLSAAEQAGNALEMHLNTEIAPAAAVDQVMIAPFIGAVNALLEEMQQATNGNSEPSINAQGIIDILHSLPPVPAASGNGEAAGELTADELPAAFLEPIEGTDVAEGDGETGAQLEERSEQIDFSRLRRIVENLGGRLSILTESGGEGSFQVSFAASGSNLEKIETLLSPFDPNAIFAPELSQQNSRLGKVLSVIKDFMKALSTGEVTEAQEVLLELAEQHQQAGLYQQIGSFARQLHDSLRNFMDMMNPALVEMVQDKLPDSGSRLEHILQVTENAANTTLDHVEALKARNQEDQSKIEQLQEIIKGMKAVGDKARERLAESHDLLTDMQASLAQTSSDLITVLTAQDYQDLTGQVIMKIIQLLKDLETNLVNLIRTFGLRTERKKQEISHELYGPAHQGKTEALHSQNDVDSLLAEFGF